MRCHASLIPSPKVWAEKLDEGNYVKRQAESCLYLGRLFLDIGRKLFIPAGQGVKLMRLFEMLMKVHFRQFDSLRALMIPVDKSGERESFYFNSMYAAFGMSPKSLPNFIDEGKVCAVLAIQMVSYLRGDRYRLLCDENIWPSDIWRKFERDAHGNAEHVCRFMLTHMEERACPYIARAARKEGELMRRIWQRQL